jgi:cytoskeletal protein RodZ
MERRLILFLVVSFALMVGYTTVLQKWPGAKVAENQPAAAQVEKKAADKDKPQAEAKKTAEKGTAEKQPAAEKNAEKEPKPEAKATAEAPAEPPISEEWLTLGSVDPKDPYRMMVTLTNRGDMLFPI